MRGGCIEAWGHAKYSLFKRASTGASLPLCTWRDIGLPARDCSWGLVLVLNNVRGEYHKLSCKPAVPAPPPPLPPSRT